MYKIPQHVFDWLNFVAQIIHCQLVIIFQLDALFGHSDVIFASRKCLINFIQLVHAQCSLFLQSLFWVSSTVSVCVCVCACVRACVCVCAGACLQGCFRA